MMKEQRAKDPCSAADSWHNCVCAQVAYVSACIHTDILCGLQLQPWVCVCVSWSRSLEAACCALICALTVCEHSKGSISTLCGISHRSHLSTFISYSRWIKSTISTVCEAVTFFVLD